MKLYLMRHGPAEDETASGRDFDRPLSPEGRARTLRVAETLKQASEAPLLILTSPLVRAVQTAEIVAVITDITTRGGRVEVEPTLAPGEGAQRRVHALQREGAKRVMLVGHEPDMSELGRALAGGSAPRSFDKAMVVALDGGGALRFVLDPKTLKVHGTP